MSSPPLGSGGVGGEGGAVAAGTVPRGSLSTFLTSWTFELLNSFQLEDTSEVCRQDNSSFESYQ